MNLNLTICFETSGPCEINIQVLKETKLTKPTCNWTRNFVQKGLWININISDYIVFTITVNFETVFYQLYKMSSYSFFINICMCIFNFFLKIFHQRFGWTIKVTILILCFHPMLCLNYCMTLTSFSTWENPAVTGKQYPSTPVKVDGIMVCTF